MGIKNYTTSIDPMKSIAEIMQLLSRRGASKIMVESDQQGSPVSLSFLLDVRGKLFSFCLPCEVDNILTILKKERRIKPSRLNREQASRVGWRIIKDWVAAQLALYEAGQSDLGKLFIGYSVTRSGESLYEHLIQEGNTLLIGPHAKGKN